MSEFHYKKNAMSLEKLLSVEVMKFSRVPAWRLLAALSPEGLWPTLQTQFFVERVLPRLWAALSLLPPVLSRGTLRPSSPIFLATCYWMFV